MVNSEVPILASATCCWSKFGGANGELAAAMQYSIHGLNCDDSDRKDMLMDIGTEELSHLEIAGTFGAHAPQADEKSRNSAEADPVIASRRTG